MSLVGPRPLILDEDQYVTDWARATARRSSRGSPASGRCSAATDIPFDEMVKLDYLYVNTWSLWNDLRLMARPVPAVFAANGRY